MRQCLTSTQGGYYTTTRDSQSDHFGRQGDFITSPEISQVFGELVGIWFVTEWMAQGRRSSGVQLIELGPGRGTLMDDMLRTITTFPEFASSIEGVYLVEAGDGLREKQRRALCGEDKEMIKTEMGWSSVSKYGGIPVMWVQDINLLAKDEKKEKMPLMIAHEFFDALPIHAFESVAVSGTGSPAPQDPGPKTSSLMDSDGKPLHSSTRRHSSTSPTTALLQPQWRELLVRPTPRPRRTDPSPLSTQKESESTPDFQLTLSPSPTPASLLLPESSPHYQALKSRVGSSIEISPDSLRHIADLATRIGGPQTRTSSRPASGAALIIDYGPASTIPLNSLRGIKNHRRVSSPFSEAGLVDLSADVDFTALAEKACEASGGVEVWGPVDQGDFLGQMGGERRVQRLVEGLEAGGSEREEKKRRLRGSWERLVDKRGPQAMGRIYKALAVVPEGGGTRAPVGFGGRVAES